MKRSQFAALIGVSKQQVSKYVAQGAVMLEGDQVLVADSLAALEGRLDEGKRQAALQAAGLLANPVRRDAAAASPSKPTARQEKDQIDLQLRLLEYGQKAGELIPARDVEDGARRAVAEMREAFANGQRALADQICATFGLAPERSGALGRMLGLGFEQALGRFSTVMTGLAVVGPAAAQAEEIAEAG